MKWFKNLFKRKSDDPPPICYFGFILYEDESLQIHCKLPDKVDKTEIKRTAQLIYDITTDEFVGHIRSALQETADTDEEKRIAEKIINQWMLLRNQDVIARPTSGPLIRPLAVFNYGGEKR
jgi:hypothetical protein